MTTTQERFEQMHAMFQPLPGEYTLNLPALRLLIEWAEGDEALAQFFGTWDQSVWNKVLLDQSAWDGGDEITQEQVVEDTRNGVCNTAYCMAGQAVVQAGHALVYDMEDEDGGVVTLSTDMCQPRTLIGYDSKGRPYFEDSGDEVNISEAALRILGMDPAEEEFFDGDNRIDDLKYGVNVMCERRGLPLEYSEVTTCDRVYAFDRLRDKPLGSRSTYV